MRRGPRLGMEPILSKLKRICVLYAMAVGTMASVVARVAWASPPIVDLLAPRGSRLGDDLRRELGASGFLVVVVEATTTDWQAEVRRLAGQPPIHGVVIRGDERLMTVFTRNGVADPLVKHLEQTVDPRDRLARRRACLSVVEYLRVLSENDPRPLPIDPPEGGARSRGAMPSPGEPAVRDARPALPGVEPGALARLPDSSPNGAGGQVGAPANAPMITEVTSAGDGGMFVAARKARVWELGAGSTLDLQAAPGGPTVHLQFLWYLPLEWRLALCVRGIWPVLGGQFRAEGNEVRAWTFGGAASLQYLFSAASARVRPYVGAAFGTRVALTETTAMNALQSRETFTPSLTLGAELGIRYGLSPLVQLFLELAVNHAWLVPGVHRAAHERQAANSDSIHASFGVLFKI